MLWLDKCVSHAHQSSLAQPVFASSHQEGCLFHHKDAALLGSTTGGKYNDASTWTPAPKLLAHKPAWQKQMMMSFREIPRHHNMGGSGALIKLASTSGELTSA